MLDLERREDLGRRQRGQRALTRARIRLEDIGLRRLAQELLGDMVYLELPAVGKRYAQGEACAVIESVKAASDVNMPVSGVVVDVNAELAKSPEQVNADAYAAWMFRIKPDNAADTGSLMDAAAYAGHAAK